MGFLTFPEANISVIFTLLYQFYAMNASIWFTPLSQIQIKSVKWKENLPSTAFLRNVLPSNRIKFSFDLNTFHSKLRNSGSRLPDAETAVGIVLCWCGMISMRMLAALPPVHFGPYGRMQAVGNTGRALPKQMLSPAGRDILKLLSATC